MANSKISKTSDRKPKKTINWGNRTRELLAEALDSSVLKLIDHGITGLEGDPSLSTLIEDEEVEQDRQKFLALCYEITEAAQSLPGAQLTLVGSNLVRIEEMYYMRMHLGADKMAELLIRFYLRHHLGLNV